MPPMTLSEALAALQEAEPAARRRGAEALGLLVESDLAPDLAAVAGALLAGLGDAYEDVRGAVVSALGQCAPRLADDLLRARVVARLVTALDDVDASVRVAAARATGHFGMRTGDAALRRAVVQDGLIVALDDFDGMVRREVVAALEAVALVAPPDALAIVPPLAVTLAQDDDRLVRYYAARALGRMAGQLPLTGEALEVIRAALSQAAQAPDAQVAKAARRALDALPPASA